jgi:hypothetical protein
VSFIHVYMHAPDDFEVWLDTEVGNSQDGLCVGKGATEEDAVSDAHRTLTAGVDTLVRRLALIETDAPAEVKR